MPPKRKRAAADSQDTSTATAPRPKKAARSATKTETTKKSKTTPIAQEDIPPPPITNAYSDAHLNQFFQKYATDEDTPADAEEPLAMSSNGIQRLFEDAGLSIEGVSPFLLAWTCQAKEFGAFQQDEFLKLSAFQVDTPDRLRAALTDLQNLFYSDTFALPSDIPTPPPPEPTTKKASKLSKKAAAAAAAATAASATVPDDVAVYSRDPLRRFGQDKRKSFKEFYMYSFGLMKKPESRVLEMEMATVTWSVVLQPKYPIMEQVLQFIEAHPSYKAVNKDLWTMTLEFCIAMEGRDLMDWNDEESWPSLLDEFVAWEKKRRSAIVDSEGDVVMT